MSRLVAVVCAGVSVLLLAGCGLSATPVPPTLSPLPTPKIESRSPLPTVVSPVTGPNVLGGADTAVRAAVNDLATRLKVAPETVQVVSVSAADWSDTSLGCPQPGMFYAQVIVQGYKIVLSAGGAQTEYHTDQKGRVVTCNK